MIEGNMELTLKKYKISREVLQKVLEVLDSHQVYYGSICDDEYNDDDVIEANDLLKAEIAKQTAPPAELPA